MREAEDSFQPGRIPGGPGVTIRTVIEQAKAGEHQPRALMMSATIYGTFLKDHEAALKLYSQARQRYPGSVYEADAIFQTAMMQYDRARYKEASSLFGLYLEKFPTGSRKDVASFLRDASDNPPAERERKAREQAPRQPAVNSSGSSSWKMPPRPRVGHCIPGDQEPDGSSVLTDDPPLRRRPESDSRAGCCRSTAQPIPSPNCF